MKKPPAAGLPTACALRAAEGKPAFHKGCSSICAGADHIVHHRKLQPQFWACMAGNRIDAAFFPASKVELVATEASRPCREVPFPLFRREPGYWHLSSGLLQFRFASSVLPLGDGRAKAVSRGNGFPCFP